ncbi:MAG: peptide/nickel transport system permease protein [Solirubrobacteraceae bacterium]|jgi:peptide/nickel transport system permease protein|nr:peptide/nickel transport system permease protein [Solirubrobacteraceae bacterium]
MGRYIARRLVGAFFLLLIVSALTFLFFNVLPSTDPAALRAGRQPTPELLAQIRQDLGLDRPVIVQFGDYMLHVFTQFDFGRSYQQDQPVLNLITARLPTTIYLAMGAVVLWLAIGLSVGVLAAVKHRSLFDRLSIGVSLIAISAPVYWLGLVSLYLFAPNFGLIPLPFVGGQGSYKAPSDDFGGFMQSMVLPWCVLAASFAAVYARVLRGSLLEVINEDYIRTARAKGLRERTVIFHHGVRSAITPVVTLLGLDLGILLGGAILTETVFNLPGVGRLAYTAIIRGDLPIIQGTVLFGAFFIVLMNLVVDVVYAFLDPRVRY